MTPLIVFDLDGTLVDSRRDLAGSANLLLKQLGAAPLSVDQVVGMVGEGARVLVGRVLDAAGVDTDLDAALTRFLAIYDEHLVDHTRLYPGVIDALQALEGRATLAVLTNKPGHHTGRLLEALEVSRYFFAVIGGDARWPRKPDPSSLQHLIAAAGASPASTIMVGDSMVDVETARGARARLCIARYGFGHIPVAETGDALVADDAQDLKALLLSAVG
jgi:phosphoglycolate phosphatase